MTVPHIDVAYVLLRFPCLTETFVAEEIQKVQSLGVKVRLFSLLPARRELVHAASRELEPGVCYVPGLHAPSLWWAQAWGLRRSPGQYFRLLGALLAQPAPRPSCLARRLVIFVKAVWLAKELGRSPVRLVHSHFAWLSGAASMVAGRLLDLPFTITTHAYDIYSPRNDLLELTTRWADRTVTISEHNRQAMLKLSSALSANRVEVIHCGIDLEHFCPPDGERQNRAFQITSVGSLIAKKGHEYLIRACGALDARGMAFRCLIVGGGELEGSLQALIQELDLQGKVMLAGAQAQTWVRDRLAESDLFALACVVAPDGERDGIPVAMMEAMAMQVPVVSTPVSGIPELIQHEETGLLVPERDANALAAAIARLAGDEPLRRKLAADGRSLVERECDIWKNASRLVRLFQQVIEERRECPSSR